MSVGVEGEVVEGLLVAEAGVEGGLDCERYGLWGGPRSGKGIDREPAFRHYSDVHVTTRIVNVESCPQELRTSGYHHWNCPGDPLVGEDSH